MKKLFDGRHTKMGVDLGHQLRSLRSLLGSALREVLLYPSLLSFRRGRKVMFLPSSGRDQSGLQRAYMIAEELDNMGWRTMVIPKHLRVAQRSRLIRFFSPEAIIVQKCRHPLNRMPYLQGLPIVLDLDDADFMDPALTKVMEAVAQNAYGVISGSYFVDDWATLHNENTTVIWTGSPVTGGPWPAHDTRERIVTWAQSNPLAQKQEFSFIEEVVLRCAKITDPFTFRLYGWRWSHDHPSLEKLRAAGVNLQLIPPLTYEQFLKSLREVSVGLSAITGSGFTQGKSFGKILGYLDARTPIICSDAADHAVFFDSASGVVSNDPDIWVKELAALLDDPERRSQMAHQAYLQYLEDLDIKSAAEKVAGFLDKTLASAAFKAHGTGEYPRDG